MDWSSIHHDVTPGVIVLDNRPLPMSGKRLKVTAIGGGKYPLRVAILSLAKGAVRAQQREHSKTPKFEDLAKAISGR